MCNFLMCTFLYLFSIRSFTFYLWTIFSNDNFTLCNNAREMSNNSIGIKLIQNLIWKLQLFFFYHNTSKSPIYQKVESNLLIADFNLQALRIQSFLLLFVILRWTSFNLDSFLFICILNVKIYFKND